MDISSVFCLRCFVEVWRFFGNVWRSRTKPDEVLTAEKQALLRRRTLQEGRGLWIKPSRSRVLLGTRTLATTHVAECTCTNCKSKQIGHKYIFSFSFQIWSRNIQCPQGTKSSQDFVFHIDIKNSQMIFHFYESTMFLMQYKLLTLSFEFVLLAA